MNLKTRITLIESALNVCTDPDVSDSYKAGYCESLLETLYRDLQELEKLPEFKQALNRLYGITID